MKESIEDIKKRMRERVIKTQREREQASKKFFEEEYPNLSQEDKAAYWASGFRQQMRWNGESGVNEMYVFDKREYHFCEEKDSDFDNLLPLIAKHLKFSLKYLKEAFDKEW